MSGSVSTLPQDSLTYLFLLFLGSDFPCPQDHPLFSSVRRELTFSSQTMDGSYIWDRVFTMTSVDLSVPIHFLVTGETDDGFICFTRRRLLFARSVDRGGMVSLLPTLKGRTRRRRTCRSLWVSGLPSTRTSTAVNHILAGPRRTLRLPRPIQFILQRLEMFSLLTGLTIPISVKTIEVFSCPLFLYLWDPCGRGCVVWVWKCRFSHEVRSNDDLDYGPSWGLCLHYTL